MDNGLVLSFLSLMVRNIWVLILVVVDNGLVQQSGAISAIAAWCLNPCCSGQWSRTSDNGEHMLIMHVLILVVVDNGLVHSKTYYKWKLKFLS